MFNTAATLEAEYTFMPVFLPFVFVRRRDFMAMFMYKRNMGNWNATKVFGKMSSKYFWANFPYSQALFFMKKSYLKKNRLSTLVCRV